jgi:hypothetical protein
MKPQGAGFRSNTLPDRLFLKIPLLQTPYCCQCSPPGTRYCHLSLSPLKPSPVSPESIKHITSFSACCWKHLWSYPWSTFRDTQDNFSKPPIFPSPLLLSVQQLQVTHDPNVLHASNSLGWASVTQVSPLPGASFSEVRCLFLCETQVQRH